MKTLELKIFDVLTEKILVSEFENWLYIQVEKETRLNLNSLVFDVISINYKNEKWSKKLESVIENALGEDFLEVLSIEQTCIKINASEIANNIYEFILPHVNNYDYDTDYDILFKFYDLEYLYNSYQYSLFDNDGFVKEAKFYSKQVVENLKNTNDLNEKKEALKIDLFPFRIVQKERETTLLEKILSFF